MASASGRVAAWVLCLLSRDCGTASASKPQAPCLKSAGSLGHPTLLPNLLSVPPTCTRRTSGSPGGRGHFLLPRPPISPPLYGPHLPPLAFNPRPRAQAQPHPAARPSPPLGSGPLSTPSAARLSPPPSRPLPFPDWLGRLRLGPPSAPLRLSAPSTAAPLCAFGAGCWGLRDWAVFARSRPATRQVPDVHLSVGPKRLFRPAISVWGGLCCCSCRGSSSPRSGREVSARGWGFAPGSSEEGARQSGRTRLLASLQTPPRAPEGPGAEVQGSRVPTVLASWLGSGRVSRRSRGGVGAEGPQRPRRGKPSSAGCAASPKIFGGGKCATKTFHWKWLCGWTPVAGGSSGSRRQTPSPLWGLETRRLRELRSQSRCSDAPRPKRDREGLVGLPPRTPGPSGATLAATPCEWVGGQKKRTRCFYPYYC